LPGSNSAKERETHTGRSSLALHRAFPGCWLAADTVVLSYIVGCVAVRPVREASPSNSTREACCVNRFVVEFGSEWRILSKQGMSGAARHLWKEGAKEHRVSTGH